MKRVMLVMGKVIVTLITLPLCGFAMGLIQADKTQSYLVVVFGISSMLFLEFSFLRIIWKYGSKDSKGFHELRQTINTNKSLFAYGGLILLLFILVIVLLIINVNKSE